MNSFAALGLFAFFRIAEEELHGYGAVGRIDDADRVAFRGALQGCARVANPDEAFAGI